MQNIDIVKWVMCKTDLLFSSSLVEQSLVKNSCSISSHSVHFNCFYDKCIVFVTSLITWHSIAIHDMSHDIESIASPIVITGLWLVYVCAEPTPRHSGYDVSSVHGKQNRLIDRQTGIERGLANRYCWGYCISLVRHNHNDSYFILHLQRRLVSHW